MKQVNKYPRKKKKKIRKAFKRLSEVITEINYHCKKIIDFKDAWIREVNKGMYKIEGDKCVNLNGEVVGLAKHMGDDKYLIKPIEK